MLAGDGAIEPQVAGARDQALQQSAAIAIGIGEDHMRRLAAELRRADLRAAGEGAEVEPGMRRQRAVRFLAAASHDVERAFRQPPLWRRVPPGAAASGRHPRRV
jgi:hypothetical protein